MLEKPGKTHRDGTGGSHLRGRESEAWTPAVAPHPQGTQMCSGSRHPGTSSTLGQRGKEGGAGCLGLPGNLHHTCRLGCLATAGQRGNSASAQPGQVHPPFASRGSGWLTAGTQLSGPLGAAVGSSLFHFPRYFEKTPFQDSQTCGHCTCLLNETQVTSAWGIKSLL